jgi:hypothetical protein
MRWGIFWSPLRFNLADCGKIINAAMLLQNFLIDQRENDIAYFQSFSVDTVVRESTDLAQGRGLPDALVTDNDALPPRGRPLNEGIESKQVGEIFREHLATRLFKNKLTRPLRNVTRNAYGQVYSS